MEGTQLPSRLWATKKLDQNGPLSAEGMKMAILTAQFCAKMSREPDDRGFGERRSESPIFLILRQDQSGCAI
jgi:hypothetical protein